MPFSYGGNEGGGGVLAVFDILFFQLFVGIVFIQLNATRV